jgi:hypothetical protein
MMLDQTEARRGYRKAKPRTRRGGRHSPIQSIFSTPRTRKVSVVNSIIQSRSVKENKDRLKETFEVSFNR